jgi:hypothetical protein
MTKVAFIDASSIEFTPNVVTDLYPKLREMIDADPQPQRRVRVEIFRRFGYFPPSPASTVRSTCRAERTRWSATRQ